MNYGPMDLLGNIGVVGLIFTYLMLQLNKLRSDGLAYSLLNAISAGLIVVSLLVNFQSIRAAGRGVLGADQLSRNLPLHPAQSSPFRNTRWLKPQ